MSIYHILEYDHSWSRHEVGFDAVKDVKAVKDGFNNLLNKRAEEDKFKLELTGMKAVILKSNESYKDFYSIIDPKTFDISGCKLKLKLKLKGDKSLNMSNRE